MNSPIDWPRFAEIVRSHQRFLLICHVRPDCDALGSELAMAGILEKLGKDVLLVNDFAIPPTLTFLDPQNKVKQLGKDVTPEQLADREVIVVLDTTAWIQLGKMADVIRQSKAIKVVLDHHVSADDLGAELFKNTDAEATGRLVVEAADALGVPLTPEIAQPAFAALATDTGWFRFSSTTADTLRLAGRLVDAGAKPDLLLQASLRTRQPGPLAAYRPHAGSGPRGAWRPVGPHLDRALRFRGHRRAGLRHGGHREHDCSPWPAQKWP